MAKILINRDELSKNTLIGGDVDTDKILPFIKASQETIIKKILGNTLYTKICDDFYDDTLTGDYLTMYEDYIKPILIHSASALFLRQAAYTVANGGITKYSGDNMESVNKSEVDFLVDSSENLSNLYKTEFEEWININYINIPEYVNVKKHNSKLVGGWIVSKKTTPNRYNRWDINNNY